MKWLKLQMFQDSRVTRVAPAYGGSDPGRERMMSSGHGFTERRTLTSEENTEIRVQIKSWRKTSIVMKLKVYIVASTVCVSVSISAVISATSIRGNQKE